jgi:hypothetical protein
MRSVASWSEFLKLVSRPKNEQGGFDDMVKGGGLQDVLVAASVYMAEKACFSRPAQERGVTGKFTLARAFQGCSMSEPRRRVFQTLLNRASFASDIQNYELCRQACHSEQ